MDFSRLEKYLDGMPSRGVPGCDIAVTLEGKEVFRHQSGFRRENEPMNGKETVYASLDLEGPFSATTFTAFGMGSHYGYTLKTDSTGPLYRHMYFDVRTGTYTDVLMSATVIGNDRDIVETVYQSIILNTLPTEQQTSSYASTLDKEGYLVSYVFQSAAD